MKKIKTVLKNKSITLTAKEYFTLINQWRLKKFIIFLIPISLFFFLTLTSFFILNQNYFQTLWFTIYKYIILSLNLLLFSFLIYFFSKYFYSLRIAKFFWKDNELSIKQRTLSLNFLLTSSKNFLSKESFKDLQKELILSNIIQKKDKLSDLLWDGLDQLEIITFLFILWIISLILGGWIIVIYKEIKKWRLKTNNIIADKFKMLATEIWNF